MSSGLAVLTDIATQFGLMSLLSVGGINAVIPEMHRLVVELRGWMTSTQFTDSFAISQAAPGPNYMIAILVGLFVAGLPGAAVATLAITAPTSLLTYFVSHAWDRFREARWRTIVQKALAPLTVGLLFSSAYVLTRGTAHGWQGYGVTAASVALMLWGRFHPLAILAIGGVLGAAGLL